MPASKFPLCPAGHKDSHSSVTLSVNTLNALSLRRTVTLRASGGWAGGPGQTRLFLNHSPAIEEQISLPHNSQ
jgi:hypothetical protein